MPKMAQAETSEIRRFRPDAETKKVIDLEVLTTTLPLLLRLAVEQNSPFSNATVIQFLF